MTREEQVHKAIEEEYGKDPSMTRKLVEGAFLMGVKWADEHPRWISVKDRLPLDSEKYLIYEKRGFVDMAYYDEDTKCWYNRGGFYVPKCWMPLPTPPRKEKK